MLPNSSGSKPAKLTLSKAVMSMKFMRKKEEVEEREKQEKQLIKELQQGNWSNSSSTEVKWKNDGSKQVTVAYGDKKVTWIRENKDLYSVLPGRRSFNGCNRSIEQYYQSLIDDKYREAASKKQKSSNSNTGEDDEDEKEEVDYDQLVSLPRGPSQGKRAIAAQDDRAVKRQKFDQPLSSSSKNPLANTNKKLQYELIRKKEIRKNLEYKKKSKVWTS